MRTISIATAFIISLIQASSAVLTQDDLEDIFSKPAAAEDSLEAMSAENSSEALYYDPKENAIYEITTEADTAKQDDAAKNGKNINGTKPAASKETQISQDPSKMSISDLVKMGLLQEQGETSFTVPAGLVPGSSGSSDFNMPSNVQPLG